MSPHHRPRPTIHGVTHRTRRVIPRWLPLFALGFAGGLALLAMTAVVTWAVTA